MKPIYFLILLALALSYFLIELFNPFLKALIVSTLLTISTSSLTKKKKKNIKNRVLATSIITLAMTSLFFIPILYCIFSFAALFSKIDQNSLISNLNHIKEVSSAFIMDFPILNDFFKDIMSKIDIGKSVQQAVSIGTLLGKNSAKFMIDMIFILIFFFLFTLYSSSIAKFLKELLPMKNDDSTLLFNESSSVMSVVFYSILVTAIFEGFLFGIFLKFFDYDALLFGVFYGFASLIPVVGGIIMWLPIAIYEATTGSITNAIIIALYSIIVISIIADTFIKPMIINYINKKVIKTPTKINSLLIFFAIVAGLGTFGFWGMIIGPALVSLFISILYLLKKYSDDLK